MGFWESLFTKYLLGLISLFLLRFLFHEITFFLKFLNFNKNFEVYVIGDITPFM